MPQNNRIKNSFFMPLKKTALSLGSLVQWYLSMQHVRTSSLMLLSARLLSWQIYLFVCLFIFLEYDPEEGTNLICRKGDLQIYP